MEDNNREYSNKDITVYWKAKECVHAGICFRELRKVFNPTRRPWVDLSQGETDEIIDIVNRCPTDALTFKYNKDIENKNQDNNAGMFIVNNNENTNKPENVYISIMQNGPILVQGNFTLIKEDESKQEIKQLASLCRCGMSHTQPLCDGTHNKRGFFPDNDF